MTTISSGAPTHRVSIDGVTYTPANTSHAGSLAIAIKTHNRPDELAQALAHHREHLPPGATVHIIDDGSNPAADIPDWITSHHRFDTPRGIVAAGNKALELAMATGAEYVSVWDDDAWPIADGWHEPFAASDEPHLAFQFADLTGPRKLKDLTEVYRDHQHVAYTGQRGVMLWYHRTAIEAVGGYDPVYGRGQYEHSDLALRIHHAGLTTWPFADIVGSDKLIYSLDEHEKVERTIPARDRQQLAKRNAELHNRRRDNGYTAYVEYRQPVDAVITSLLTAQPDPQRGKKWPADPKTLTAWAKSITDANAIVLADELDTPPPGVTLERVPACGWSPYFARWLHLYRHLRAHPEYRWVWATDGGDVTFLRPPWPHMQPATLYVGWEPQTVGCDWLRTNHRAAVIQDFINTDPGRTLLNLGVVGGDRTTIQAFAHHMTRLYQDNAARRFWGKEQHDLGFDMGAGNLIAYTHFADQLVTGPRVTSLFKHQQKAEQTPAWIAHK